MTPSDIDNHRLAACTAMMKFLTELGNRAAGKGDMAFLSAVTETMSFITDEIAAPIANAYAESQARRLPDEAYGP